MKTRMFFTMYSQDERLANSEKIFTECVCHFETLSYPISVQHKTTTFYVLYEDVAV